MTFLECEEHLFDSLLSRYVTRVNWYQPQVVVGQVASEEDESGSERANERKAAGKRLASSQTIV